HVQVALQTAALRRLRLGRRRLVRAAGVPALFLLLGDGRRVLPLLAPRRPDQAEHGQPADSPTDGTAHGNTPNLSGRRPAAVPRPRQPTLPSALKSSGVSNSASVTMPMLMPPGIAPLALRPFQTPPPCRSTNSRMVTPRGNSTQPGLLTWPLMQYNLGP